MVGHLFCLYYSILEKLPIYGRSHQWNERFHQCYKLENSPVAVKCSIGEISCFPQNRLLSSNPRYDIARVDSLNYSDVAQHRCVQPATILNWLYFTQYHLAHGKV